MNPTRHISQKWNLWIFILKWSLSFFLTINIVLNLFSNFYFLILFPMFFLTVTTQLKDSATTAALSSSLQAKGVAGNIHSYTRFYIFSWMFLNIFMIKNYSNLHIYVVIHNSITRQFIYEYTVLIIITLYLQVQVPLSQL
jgi:hypothetical protein